MSDRREPSEEHIVAVGGMLINSNPFISEIQRVAEHVAARESAARDVALDEALAACDRAVPRAHTYASENADIYLAGDDARERCKVAIEALKGAGK